MIARVVYLLAVSSAVASADTAPKGALEVGAIGARVGANFASVDTDPSDESAFMKVGMVVAGFATLRLARYVEAELGLGYSQRGFNLESAAPTQSEASVALNYLEAPMLARARVPWGKTPATLRFATGANLLVLTSARARDNDENIDLRDQTANLDLALVIGAGLDISFGSWIGLVDFRYDHGLLDVNSDQGGINIYNRVASLQFGAAF